MVTNGPAQKITGKILAQVAGRSFFLQASWNFRRMQNAGFCYAFLPVIRALYPDASERRRAAQRHLEFFNTHPYCAPIILGVVARLEEEAVGRQADGSPEAGRVKSVMMGPLAAFGDTVFWATLRPALALLGAGVVLLSPGGKVWPALWGPLLFLALFSAAQLSLCAWGLWTGYRQGLEVVKNLRRLNPQLIARRIGYLISVVLGTLLVAYPAHHLGLRGWRLHAGIAGMAALSAGLVWLLRRGLSVGGVFYLLAAAGIAGAYAGLW